MGWKVATNEKTWGEEMKGTKCDYKNMLCQEGECNRCQVKIDHDTLHNILQLKVYKVEGICLN